MNTSAWGLASAANCVELNILSTISRVPKNAFVVPIQHNNHYLLFAVKYLIDRDEYFTCEIWNIIFYKKYLIEYEMYMSQIVVVV